jgi:nitric oxide reductase NorQ protein
MAKTTTNERIATMSIALLIESGLPDGSAQTLLVPNYSTGNVDLFHRTRTGMRGRSEVWVKTNITDISDYSETYEPVAVRLTTNDHADIANGKVTDLAIKAMKKVDTTISTPTSHREVAITLYTRLLEQDSTLSQYIVDSRFNDLSSLVIDPLTAPIQVSTQEVSTPTLVSQSSASLELAVVPDRKWADTYIQRKVVGDTTEFDVFDKAMRSHTNVLIKGHAGSGKTMSVMAYASKRNYRYYNVSSHIGVEPSQLFGKWNPTCDGHFGWQDGPVTDLVRNGGVILINEVNFLPERVTTVLFSLLDDRREIQLMDKDGEVVKAHKDLLIVADMNPNYRGTRPLTQAWADRYVDVLEFPYDPTIEQSLIPSKSLLDMASQLRDRFEQDEIRTPISTRGLVGFVKNFEELGIDYAIYSYLNKFGADEQAGVGLVIDTYKQNILADFGKVFNIDLNVKAGN